MQSEDFDKKIRDAADNHHPPYNEKAWTKMEKLLDKHLPNEKDNRRRFIFFALLFLLLGGGTWLFISQPWKTTSVLTQSTTETTAKDNSQEQSKIPAASPNGQDAPGTSTTTTVSNTSPSSTDNAVDNEHTTPHGQPATATLKPGQSITTNKPSGEFSVNTTGAPVRSKPVRQKPADDFGIVTGAPGRKQKGKKQEEEAVVKPVIEIADNPKNNTSEEAAKKQTDIADTGKEPQKKTTVPPVNPANPATDADKAKTDNKKDEPVKDPETAPVTPSAKKKKARKPTENGLAFTLSAGPDLSYVGSRTGKWQPVVGAGLSYTFAKRFTLRSGFYTASKIYSASPEDYNPKTPPPTPQYLKLIDANCKVYEIPVSLAYQFTKTKNSSWFAAAGLSSYIMKEEKYEYLYEYPGGQPWTYNWDLKNKNKHMFSVLSLSAGYSRKLGRIFTVSAEPYFKMPLNGVGFGKVKLNSTGVLVTLSTRLTGN